jgi:WD40 repeat protein
MYILTLQFVFIPAFYYKFYPNFYPALLTFNTSAFSPSGQLLASGNFDKTIKMWNVQTGKELCTLNGHTQLVLSVAFTPDDKFLISVDNAGIIKIWQRG